MKRDEPDLIKQTERSITVAGASMDALHAFVVAHGFLNKQEEIQFFKTKKPLFYSLLIYYLKILRIETRKPFGIREIQMEYYRREQAGVQHFFETNLPFYQYFRMNSHYLDEQYFLRSNTAVLPDLDYYYFNSDHRFSSPQDDKVAQIMANELLLLYLEKNILDLQEPVSPDSSTDPKGKLTWTGSKTSLIELIYALQSNGVFDNSAADLKKVASSFEKMFNIELGNYYRVFQDIRIRKKNRTQFLDELKTGLERRMDEADENPRLGK